MVKERETVVSIRTGDKKVYQKTKYYELSHDEAYEIANRVDAGEDYEKVKEEVFKKSRW